MSIVDQINDIVADQEIDEQERRRIIGALRSGYLKDRLEDIPLPRVFVRGLFTIVLTKIELHGISLYLWIDVKRRAQNVPISLPVIIVRPPLLISDPLGTIVRDGLTYRLDPIAAFLEYMSNLIVFLFQSQ